MTYPVTTNPVTIANGASLSGPTYIGLGKLIAIQMPASWDAADLTLEASADGTTYQNVYDDNDAEVTIQAAQARYVSMRTPLRIGPWIKLRSGTSGVAVAQNADRVLIVVVHKDVPQ